jgi:hypothetical protein
MTIREMVQDKKVRFQYYREGELWYATEDGFKFPVPTSDVGTAVFNAEEKAIMFMRWIRKHLEMVSQWGASDTVHKPMSAASVEVLTSIPEENVMREEV